MSKQGEGTSIYDERIGEVRVGASVSKVVVSVRRQPVALTWLEVSDLIDLLQGAQNAEREAYRRAKGGTQ